MRIALIAMALLVCGCSPHEAPLLTNKDLLSINSGLKVRVIGTARYLQTTGPAIASESFELRVYPKDSWGPSLEGKHIEVTGVLHDSTKTTPPDPSFEPGEYWLSDVHWKALAEEK